jgi:hypothetical protein
VANDMVPSAERRGRGTPADLGAPYGSSMDITPAPAVPA